MARLPAPMLISRRQWFGVAGLGWQFFRSGSARKLVPPSESVTDPQLSQLLKQMQGIVLRRDATVLTSLMDKIFRVEWDRGQGPLAFQKFWRPEDPETELWKVMTRLLAMRGTFYSPTLFAIPYVYTQFPIDLNPWNHIVALQQKVVVWARPNDQASKVSTLSFDIVPTAEELRPPVVIDRRQWLRVLTPEQGEGYVASSEIWSPVAHRVFFEKRNGTWKWISLVCAARRLEPVQRRKPLSKAHPGSNKSQ